MTTNDHPTHGLVDHDSEGNAVTRLSISLSTLLVCRRRVSAHVSSSSTSDSSSESESMLPLTNGDLDSRPERTARLAKSTAMKRMRFVLLLLLYLEMYSLSRLDVCRPIWIYLVFTPVQRSRMLVLQPTVLAVASVHWILNWIVKVDERTMFLSLWLMPSRLRSIEQWGDILFLSIILTIIFRSPSMTSVDSIQSFVRWKKWSFFLSSIPNSFNTTKSNPLEVCCSTVHRVRVKPWWLERWSMNVHLLIVASLSSCAKAPIVCVNMSAKVNDNFVCSSTKPINNDLRSSSSTKSTGSLPFVPLGKIKSMHRLSPLCWHWWMVWIIEVKSWWLEPRIVSMPSILHFDDQDDSIENFVSLFQHSK